MPSVLDYMDWVVAALLHHGFMIRLEKNKRQGVLPTMPPITVFGHDFGSTVAFELIRMLKKSESVYMPIHHFIASACRPPEVFCAFFFASILSYPFNELYYDYFLSRLYQNLTRMTRAENFRKNLPRLL